MIKAVEGAYIMFMSWLKLQRGFYYVYFVVKAVEGAYIMFISWLKLKRGLILYFCHG